MASIDIDSLQLPVDSDHPAGEDLEYDPLFSEMELAAAGKPQQQMGDAVIDAEEPDWRLVQRNALKLLARSKDLRICVYLCQAALQNEGIEGFSAAVQLTSLLTQQFWPSLHPELDSDDDDDPTARVNAVMALTSAARLLRPIEHAPLLSVPMLGAVSWADVKPTSGDDQPRHASSEVEAIITNCEPEQIAQRRSAITAALQACQTLETFITSEVGASRAPNLQSLRDLLKRIDAQLTRWWEQRGGDQQPEEASEVSQAGEEDGGDDGDATPRRDAALSTATPPRFRATMTRSQEPIGAITSRQEAIAAIEKILEYYRRHEPSSPLPLLLARAKRLAPMSFIEILQDLIPEGLSRANEIGGLSSASGYLAESASHSDAADADSGSGSDEESTNHPSVSDDEDTDDDFFQ
jgi:type VI secretion system protein ImpA